VSLDRSFLEAVFDGAEGYAHFAIGMDAHADPTGGYRHRKWEAFAVPWPQQSNEVIQMVTEFLGQEGRNDLYFCPNILKTEKRNKGTAVAFQLLHSDADNGADAAKLESLGAFAVASGRSGHSHVYVRLDRPVPLAQYQTLQRGMRAYFNGDNKISDNDLLRPVGAVNYKAVVLDGLDQPYPVEWIVKPTGFRIDPRAAAAVLGVTLPEQDGPEPHSEPTNSSSTSPAKAGGGPGHVEAFDLAKYPDVRRATEKDSGDRSADTQRIVGVCFRAALRLPQIRWAVNQRPDLRERLDERADDDVLRIFVKLVDAEQPNKAGAQGANDIEAFDADVARELHTLRVRDEARRRLAAEKESATKPFDAGLLEEILARPPEPPFRIEGLLPSEAGMLVVAQRKTGKTTLMLNLARSLLTGQRFLGRFEVRPLSGRIAILNFEVSGPQLARWADEVGVLQHRLFLVNLRGCRNPLSHPDDRTRVAALLKEQQVECVIVDPFARAYGGTNQNDSGEVGAFLSDLDRFARTEVGALDLILTTHAGWNAERTRGSSALEDWADSVVTMTRGSDKDEDTRYLRAIGRDVHLDEDQLHFDPETRLLSLTGTGSRKDTRKKAKADSLLIPVELYVAEHPGVSTAGLTAGIRQQVEDGKLNLSFQDADVRTAAKLAAEQGLIVRNEGGSGKPTKHYPVEPTTEDSNVDGSSEVRAQGGEEEESPS
jgi:AAA domain